MYEQLADAGAVGWEGFTAQFTPPAAFEVPGLSTPAQRFTAKLSYHGKPFASVPVEVSAVEAGNAERYDAVASDALALVGLPPADAVPCMTLPWQVAQKLHACTDPVEEPRTNDRAHDLFDLLLIEALLVDEPLADTRAACLAVFRARRRQTWPPAIAPRRHWEPIYRRALEGLSALDLPPSAVEAAERVQAFVDRIDVA